MPDDFTSPDSIEAGKAAAALALGKFSSLPGFGNDDIEDVITDLIANLAHLADDLIGPGVGTTVIDRAQGHYDAEYGYERPDGGESDGIAGLRRRYGLDDDGTPGTGVLYALVTGEGTAMSETALCREHFTAAHRLTAMQQAGQDAAGDVFADCSGNDELSCIVCGRTNTGPDTTKL